MNHNPSKLWYLQRLALFERLPAPAHLRLERASFMRTHTKGELLFRPGGAAGKIFIIKSGQVKLFRSQEGKRVIIATLGAGDTFGDFSFSGGAAVPAGYFAEALGDTLVCIMSTADLGALAQAYPQVAIGLIGKLSARLYEAEAKIENLALSRAEVRVFRELRRQAEVAENKLITPALTHEAIAEATGLTRETVTRALAKLKKQHCLKPLPHHRHQLLR